MEAGLKQIITEKKTIIIVTGGPGTGKSGTASRLLSRLGGSIVRVGYDEIKEKNWDAFGFDDATQKDQLNAWSLEELYLTLRKYMYEEETILTEYPYYQRHKPRLAELIDRYGYFAVTIYLYTDRDTVYQRAVKRDMTESRHPGHFLTSYHRDDPDIEERLKQYREPEEDVFFAAIRGKEYNICLGTDIPVDVTDFSKIPYSSIIEQIVREQKQSIS